MKTQKSRSIDKHRIFITHVSDREANTANKKIPKGTQVCSVCGIEKDNNEYNWYSGRFTKDGYRLRTNTNCRSCASLRHLQTREAKKKAGVPRPEPNTPCNCCGKPTEKLEFDHDHTTSKFRGWVCKDCNVGFGKFGDSAEGIVDAIMYLYGRSNEVQKKATINKLAEYVASEK
jgi:hypothetical protein